MDSNKINIDIARQKAEQGERLELADALVLYEDNDLLFLAQCARKLKERKSGKSVFYNVNRHINLTNICTSHCPLCAFQCEEGDARGFVLEFADIEKILKEAQGIKNLGEIHIVSALHPQKDFAYYLSVVQMVKAALPKVDIKAFTPVEIVHFAQMTGKSVEEVLRILQEAGLSSLPGGGAEILSDRVRQIICPNKATAAEWIDVMKTAHRLGIRTNATMMYGHIETVEERLQHLVTLREIQDETKGFQAFVAFPFHPANTRLGEEYHLQRVGSWEDMKMLALSRLILDNIDHIKLLALGAAADAECKKRFGDTVTFIIDRNINYTNVCVNECKFCAFFRRKEHPQAYLLSVEDILAKVQETVDAGGTQLMIQGGLHPDLGLDYYEKMLSAIKSRYDIIIHSFTATEIQYFASQAGISVLECLKRLQAAGLDSLPGGGAEILVDEVRKRVSPKKIMTDDWLSVMEAAHSIGMESTATMVIGFGETMAQRIEHMERIRRLQDKTGGFRAFITWSYQPGNTALGGEKTSGWDYMRTLAVSRLYMDNVAHVQGSWVTQGERIGQLTLGFGADDLGSIMLEENVVRAAGTAYDMSIKKMVGLIRGAGKQAAQRDTQYNILKRF